MKNAEALGSCAFPGRAPFAEAYPEAARLVYLLRPGFGLLGDLSSLIDGDDFSWFWKVLCCVGNDSIRHCTGRKMGHQWVLQVS